MRHLLLLLLTLPAFGKAPEPVREVRLRLVAVDPAIARKCLIADPAVMKPEAEQPAEIRAILAPVAEEIRLKGNDVGFLKFPAPKDPMKPEVRLPTVTLPKAGNRFIVLFLPPVVPSGECRTVTVDDSAEEFPAGTCRVLNQSSMAVKLTLAGKAFEIKAGDNLLIKDQPVNAKNLTEMYAYRFEGGKWARIGAGIWPHPGKRRSVQVFWDNAVSGKTELKGFREVNAGK